MKHNMLAAAILAGSAVARSASAQEFNIDLQVDSDGKVSPETSLPYNWNKNWYSEVRYRSLTTTTDNESNTLSRSTSTLEQQYVRLNVLGYQNANERSTHGFAVGAEAIKINRSEFGFGPIASQTLIIDNQVDILSARLVMSGFYEFKTDYIDMHFGANISPAGQLYVNQQTAIEYNSSFATSHESNTAMALSYGADVAATVKTGFGLDVKLSAEYLYLPMDYSLALVNSTADAFEETDIEEKQTSVRYGVKFVLPAYEDKGRPVIGFSQEKIATDQNGSTGSETINYLIVGLSKSF
jgi:hypothetical protein